MPDPIDQIADAIVAYLPTGTYSDLDVTAENCIKRYTAIRDAKQLEEHRVVVIPTEIETEVLCRPSHSRANPTKTRLRWHILEILVERQASEEDATLMTQLRNLVDEIDDYLVGVPQAGFPWKDQVQAVVADAELLTTNHVYAGAIRIRFGK